MAGKGSKRRPCLVNRKEEALRYQLAFGQIAFKQFEEKMKKLKDNKNARTQIS